jgi:hypothetical protein
LHKCSGIITPQQYFIKRERESTERREMRVSGRVYSREL